MIVLVLGGTRSGKSGVAERLAAAQPAPVTYLATATVGDDAAFAERIAHHRARRPSTWTTVEAGAQLVLALRAAAPGTVLVDSLGTWVASHLDLGPDRGPDVDGLVATLAARGGTTVLVSEEVGWAVHPETEAGRRFVDAMGQVNLAVAGIADEVLLVVAGRVLRLDAPPRTP